MKVSISKVGKWNEFTFAKAPLELLFCDDLSATSKILWIVLANQADYKPIDKSVIDKRLGIHRSTRIRCLEELKEYGFVKGTQNHIMLTNPIPILRKLRDTDNKSRAILDSEVLELKIQFNSEENDTSLHTSVKKVNYSLNAKNAWNNFRPKNYSKLNVMSGELLKAIDLHMDSLQVEKHDYEYFFSILKTGIEHSDFWAERNTSKNLQSVIGIGQPQPKKYQNVQALFNEGLNYEAALSLQEEERQDDIILPARLRKLIDSYDELHYLYFNMSRNDPDKLDSLTPRIIQIEQEFRKEKLDPARFRMKYQLKSWPTSVPEPTLSRKTFWKYDDEIN